MSCRLKIKSATNGEPEISWQSGKIAFKLECAWKDESAIADRKGEIDFTYEYRVPSFISLFFFVIIMIKAIMQNSSARNSVNVRAIAFKNPVLGNAKDTMICLKAEGNFLTPPSDMIDISGYTQPPNAHGNIEFVMGEVKNLANQVF